MTRKKVRHGPSCECGHALRTLYWQGGDRELGLTATGYRPIRDRVYCPACNKTYRLVTEAPQ